MEVDEEFLASWAGNHEILNLGGISEQKIFFENILKLRLAEKKKCLLKER